MAARHPVDKHCLISPGLADPLKDEEALSRAIAVTTGGQARPAHWGGGPSRRRVLLGDLDDPLHPQLGVAAPVLGVHEAHLDVDTGLGGDRLLLESFV